jgi:hypothetical protein
MTRGYDNVFGLVPGHVPGSRTGWVGLLCRIARVISGVVGRGMRESGHRRLVVRPAAGVREARDAGLVVVAGEERPLLGGEARSVGMRVGPWIRGLQERFAALVVIQRVEVLLDSAPPAS